MVVAVMRGPAPGRALAFAALLLRASADVPKLDFNVIERFPHQQTCFTEGLFLNGSKHEVFESCGLYGRSYLRRYHLRTGQTLQTARVPAQIFSEGLALMGHRLYMLTYHAKKILEFDVRTFELSSRTHPFPYGEGWGLTTDGCDLLATTGSSFIFRLRPSASGVLELVTKVQVTHKGRPLVMLNELEYVTPKVWVNQWHTNTIWRVDPTTGAAEAHISVRGLHHWSGESTPNGIAYSVVLGRETLLVTGKQWPEMFALHMLAQDLCGGAAHAAAPACPRAPASACWPPPSVAAPSAGKAASTPPHAPPKSSRVSSQPPPAMSAAAVPEVREGDPAAPRARLLVQPLPGVVTAEAVLLALVLATAAVAVPLCICSRRHRYRLAAQRVEMDTSP
uniref:Glutamine cyclotransferase n=1 Tax=Alexandrium monilatum TaxID=311494 RepID=A0A7S4WGD0_9DINO|mmetsp:Transcript_41810/g.130647  ORF Transcript_41810/g.130647 Transcript_41810/m.130647 type:complete len:393 (+) Transcript_41810:53-1231(+)